MKNQSKDPTNLGLPLHALVARKRGLVALLFLLGSSVTVNVNINVTVAIAIACSGVTAVSIGLGNVTSASDTRQTL